MRAAMVDAEVGDDVYGEDPTVAELESRVAALLGQERALFVPSGTMANQIAIRAHCEPADEVILEGWGHSFAFESGAMSGLSGVQAYPVEGVRGLMSVASIAAAIRPAADHFPRTALVIVENTANLGGGTIYSPTHISEIRALTRERGLKLHLDGARLWNAHVATGAPLSAFASECDSVSVCLSKGLGAPVGSLVAGSAEFITKAHRLRKMMGGGMRQIGILAAAGMYAIEHHLDRLTDDHANLRALAEGITGVGKLRCEPEQYPTNILFVEVDDGAADIESALQRAGVLCHSLGPNRLRFVTHLDVDRAAIDHAIGAIRRVVA